MIGTFLQRHGTQLDDWLIGRACEVDAFRSQDSGRSLRCHRRRLSTTRDRRRQEVLSLRPRWYKPRQARTETNTGLLEMSSQAVVHHDHCLSHRARPLLFGWFAPSLANVVEKRCPEFLFLSRQFEYGIASTCSSYVQQKQPEVEVLTLASNELTEAQGGCVQNLATIEY